MLSQENGVISKKQEKKVEYDVITKNEKKERCCYHKKNICFLLYQDNRYCFHEKNGKIKVQCRYYEKKNVFLADKKIVDVIITRKLGKKKIDIVIPRKQE